MSDWDTEVDVLVVGAGGADSRAVAAHDAGAIVAIAEKLDRIGGNTRSVPARLPGAGTRFQRAWGSEDSPERLGRDLRGLSGFARRRSALGSPC